MSRIQVGGIGEVLTITVWICVVKEPRERGGKKNEVLTESHDTDRESLGNDLKAMIKESLDQRPESLIE